MRHYVIFWIEQDVATHYFGQEFKLFRFFLQAREASNDSVEGKQRAFITRPIPTTRLADYLSDLPQDDTHHHYHVHLGTSDATLYINEDCLELTAEGQYEAETIFFERLRRIDPCFLAMDFEHHRYGWMNPVRQEYVVSGS